MDGRQNISQYRDRLDKTLMSHDLSNEEFLKTLVENQVSNSTENEDQEDSNSLVQKRTKEVANFLSMLRSASGHTDEGSKVNEIPNGGWKIKHDNQDCRVMYREGPVGTPFHTLLVEGYVDGPLDVCMCISWEATLYKKWWPQFTIPTFKVTSSECVKKIKMGEQIALVRMKPPWPLTDREALVHFVTLDYFKDDLIIVLLNTISETEEIDKSTHGFSKDGIPDVENVTRIDIVGGLALQKVSATRSYFRATANMDIKLDFAPPAIINFVSRQLIGSGFKLYKKEVASVTKGDADFSKALTDPFYGHIREALYSENSITTEVWKQENVKVSDEVLEEKDIEIVDVVLEQETVNIVQPEDHCTVEIEEVNYHSSVSEIEEIEETGKSNEDYNNSNGLLVVSKKEIVISPEVNQALGTLEKVISVFREFGFNPRSLSLSRFVNNVFADLEDNKANESKHFVNELRRSFSRHSSRHKGRTSYAKETPEDETSSPEETYRSSFSFAVNEAKIAENIKINGELKNGDESGKKMKKRRFCCLSFTSSQIIA